MNIEKPSWVETCVIQWASENHVSPDDYEASFINGGYYLYKKRTSSDKSHTYIGSIKEDGIHPARSRRTMPKSYSKTQQSVTLPSIMSLPCLSGTTTLQAYEFGFSRSVIEFTERIPKWKQLYKDDDITVLLSLIQTLSHQSYTALYFAKPEESKYHLGFARRYLNSMLPVQLDNIMSIVGNVSVFQDSNDIFSLSHLTEKHHDFFRKYNISLEV